MNTVQHLIRRAYGLLVTGANFLQPPVVAIQEGLCRSRRTSFSRNQMQLGRCIQMTSTYKERDLVKLAIEAHGGLEVGVEFPPFED